MILSVLKKIVVQLSTPVQILPERPANPFFESTGPDPRDLFPWEEPYDDADDWPQLEQDDALNDECGLYGADDAPWSDEPFDEDDLPKGCDEDVY